MLAADYHTVFTTAAVDRSRNTHASAVAAPVAAMVVVAAKAVVVAAVVAAVAVI